MADIFYIQFEKAIQLLAEHLPISSIESRKPILFHDIRVGVYLYEKGYKPAIILAGVLHDAIEWSSLDAEKLKKEFGENVVKLVLANSKDDSILDNDEKISELINRCIKCGQDALIIKVADIIDSFKWYRSQNNKDELKYCSANANAIFKFKPDSFNDPIFDELKSFNAVLLDI